MRTRPRGTPVYGEPQASGASYLPTQRPPDDDLLVSVGSPSLSQTVAAARTSSDALRWSLNYMDAIVPSVNPKRSCIVLDIDGTILDVRRHNVVCDILVHQIFRRARDAGIPVYIVTARSDSPANREATKRDLLSCGYPPSEYAALHMMPAAYEPIARATGSFSGYKALVRERIASREGKDVLLNVGDQWADLLRIPPHHSNQEQRQIVTHLLALPEQFAYVGNLPDVAWMSVKLPPQ